MDYNFSIPHFFSNLTTKGSKDDYVVDEIIPIRLLPSKITDARSALKSFEKGTAAKYFDTFYSVLSHPTKSADNLERSWDILMKYLDYMSKLLPAQLEGHRNVNDTELRNSFMMLLYITTEFARQFENDSTKTTMEQAVAGKKKKGRKTVTSISDADFTLDWSSERRKVIKYLTQIFLLPIQRMWDPPSVDQPLVNSVGTLCFKLLENTDIMKMKDTKEETFRLLAILVKRHQYSLNVATQIIECLRVNESSAVIMAQVLAVITREFSFKSTVHEVINELSSLSADYLLKDSAATRAYSTLLTELTEMIPDVVMPMISILMHFLETDPYTMRCAMIVVLGKLVMNLLTGDNLDQHQKNAREEFLDTICEHMHDGNSYVRAKVLQVLISVVENKALPVSRFVMITELVKGRIADRVASVRKYALQSLMCMMSHNPYAAQLREKDIESTLSAEKQKLSDLEKSLPQRSVNNVISADENWNAMKPEISSAIESVLEDLDSSRADHMEDSLTVPDSMDSVKETIIQLISECLHLKAVRFYINCESEFSELSSSVNDYESPEDRPSEILSSLEKIFLSQPDSQVSLSDEPDVQDIVNKMNTQKLVIKYLEESSGFTRQIKSAMPLLCKLLMSKTNSDIIESIQFVVTSVKFGLTDSMTELATMLKLVWINDKSIKEAVVNAFKVIFLQSDQQGVNQECDIIVKSLLLQTRCFTNVFGLLTSWEELVSEFVRAGEISNKVLQMLWQTFTNKIPNTCREDRHAALLLLGMCSRAEPTIIASNLDVLISDGLEQNCRPSSSEQMYFIRDVCFAILTINGVSEKDKKVGVVKKSSVQKLKSDHELVKILTEIITNSYSNMTVNGWIPLMEQVIKVIFTLSETPDTTSGVIIKNLFKQLQDQHAPTTLLSRFIALIGHVMMCQIIYLEKDVLQELKVKKPKENSKQTDSTGDELGTTTTDDFEQEVVLKVIETELLQDGNLLANFLPLLTLIGTNQNLYTDESLQAAVTLALGKYMLVSSACCQNNLRLYFTILEKSKYESVKTNAIIALSDLVFKFPNELEPWTAHLYARLRDDSAAVRKSTLIVMTRLILNDMVKIKGQISDVACCLVDTVVDIREMAAQFFSELATKGRALYNVILDIVSRLSDPEVGVPEEDFLSITTELFTHMKNDKLCYNLTERLLLRFQATTEVRQWRDLAYCISRLSHCDKSIKKIQESFSLYADKLGDEKIYEYFTHVITTTKQKPPTAIKQQTKEVLVELGNKFDIAHQKGVEDLDALENAESVAPLNKTQSRKSARTRQRRQTRSRAQSDSDESDSSIQSSVSSQATRKSSRTSVCSVKPASQAKQSRQNDGAALRRIDNLIQELSESEESDLELPQTFSKSRKAATSKDKKTLSFSSSDEEMSAADVLTPKPRRSQRIVKT